MQRTTLSLVGIAPLVAFALTACGTDGRPLVLPTSAYFTAIPSGYTSVDACLTATGNTPTNANCVVELGLCATGRASMRIGSTVTDGHYQLDPNDSWLASGELAGVYFEYNVETAADLIPPSGAPHTWESDTRGRWQGMIFSVLDCSQSPTM